jgi:hypothetical protein
MIVSFSALLWRWEPRRGEGWTFVSLPLDASAEIRDIVGSAPRRGFGAVRVRVTLGGSSWSTSLFPYSGREEYVLPVKRSVRVAESLSEGDMADVTVEVVGM